jgi:hypothetical protein
MDFYNQSQQLLLQGQKLVDDRKYNEARLVLEKAKMASDEAIARAQLRVSAAAATRETEDQRDRRMFKEDPEGFANYYSAKRGAASSIPGLENLFPPNTARPVAGGRGARPPPAGFNVD